MRQAGRYHDHYQSLKKDHTFEELCKKPILAAETAMGPINEFDFDVAILFSDILFPLEALGMDLSYNPGPQFGLHLDEDNAESLLVNQNPINFMEFQGEAIERTIERLPSDKSLIGFVGGPWTLIAYACNISKDSRELNFNNFQIGLLDNVILPLLKENVELQLNAGAEVVMIFDSNAHLLAEEDLNIYLDKTFNALAKEFPYKVGYYAKDGIDYEAIIAKQNDPEINLAGMGLDSNIDLKEYFKKTTNGFVQSEEKAFYHSLHIHFHLIRHHDHAKYRDLKPHLRSLPIQNFSLFVLWQYKLSCLHLMIHFLDHLFFQGL